MANQRTIKIPIVAEPQGTKEAIREYRSMFEQIRKEAAKLNAQIPKSGVGNVGGGFQQYTQQAQKATAATQAF